MFYVLMHDVDRLSASLVYCSNIVHFDAVDVDNNFFYLGVSRAYSSKNQCRTGA
jgi:hypothetical protein